MDPTIAAVLLSRQLQTQAAVGVQVLRKVLDFQTQQGEQLAQLVAQAGGVGTRLDVQA